MSNPIPETPFALDFDQGMLPKAVIVNDGDRLPVGMLKNYGQGFSPWKHAARVHLDHPPGGPPVWRASAYPIEGCYEPETNCLSPAFVPIIDASKTGRATVLDIIGEASGIDFGGEENPKFTATVPILVSIEFTLDEDGRCEDPQNAAYDAVSVALGYGDVQAEDYDPVRELTWEGKSVVIPTARIKAVIGQRVFK